MRRLKAFKSSVKNALGRPKSRATNQTLTDFERFASVDPAHIGVAQDPPICRNCNNMLISSREAIKPIKIADGINRVKASAELGCYICSLLFNGDWLLFGAESSDLFPARKLSSINPLPDTIWCNVIKRGDKRRSGSKNFELVAITANPSGKDTWISSSVILIPEETMEVEMFRTVEAVNSADIVAKQALSWIEKCQTTHSECQLFAPSTTWKPTRLIYTGQPDKGLVPRLCISSELPSDITYITLSHCWGLVEIFKLVSSNLINLLEELPLLELTQVFQDVIDLTRRLGISYLWIDSLCIIQDSAKDWEHESTLMGNIYKHSWCNIAATGFKNGLQGIYVKRNSSILSPITVNTKVNIPGRVLGTKTYKGRCHCLENYWDKDVTNAPLNQRAWVYQERLLSPRILHLGSRQAYWECCQMEACESSPNGLPTALGSHFKNATKRLLSMSDAANSMPSISTSSDSSTNSFDCEREILHLWWEIVKGYNGKSLTKHEDKLIAISGVAELMQRYINDEYVAGLWKKHLLNHMCWSVVKPTNISRAIWAQKPRPQFYQAPSWSWASLNESTENFIVLNYTTIANVIDYKVTLASSSKFGRVTNGFIRIRGRLTQATFKESDQTLRKNWMMPLHALNLRAHPSKYTSANLVFGVDIRRSVPVEDGVIYPYRDAIGSRDFYLLPICERPPKLVGLILQHTVSGIQGQYQRLGIFYIDNDEKSFQALKSHIPLLYPEEYEEYDGCESTITII